MILDLQRKLMEAGRIRIGQQVTSSNGKSRPAKLGTFRLTSADRLRIEQAAHLYGGTCQPWTAPAGQQWEVITDSDVLDVIVPPSAMAFSQSYELWSKGGCQRRCDGGTESITEQPCICDPENRECDIHTRLSVMLKDLPGLGVWRLDTQGWYAAAELQGAVDVIQMAAGRGALLPARLRLEQRTVKRPSVGTRNFAVPVLDIDITPAQLLGGGGLGLATADRPALPAGDSGPRNYFTPVPAELPVGPQQSIAEQSQPPPPKPKRANSAAEIPPSGRQRRPPVAAEEQPSNGDRMSSQQQKILFALLRNHEIEDRMAWASGILGREVTSYGQLAVADAAKLIDALKSLSQATDGDTEVQPATDEEPPF
jgi:hypothetical protein